MTTEAIIEYRNTHLASCRHRRQGLVCSMCCEAIEQAERIIERERRAAQIAA